MSCNFAGEGRSAGLKTGHRRGRFGVQEDCWVPLDHGPPLIDRMPPRMLFAELVAGALDRTGVAPSPHAAAYLVDLLAEAVRPGPDPAAETFTEGSCIPIEPTTTI